MERLGKAISKACVQISPDRPQMLRLLRVSSIRIPEYSSGRATSQNPSSNIKHGRRGHISTPIGVTSRVSNDPNRPVVERVRWSEVATRVPTTSRVINIPTHTHLRIEREIGSAIEDTYEELDTPNLVMTPTSPKPITPFRELEFADGHKITVGGGTSNKSLKEARKKARRRA